MVLRRPEFGFIRMMNTSPDKPAATRVVRADDFVAISPADLPHVLDQARRTRDAAWQMMHERFARDLELTGLMLGSDDNSRLSAKAELASRLTAAYLVESERLFSMMRPLSSPHQQPQQ
jgi:hypothetical protein